MKLFSLLIFFPIFSFSQYPLVTDNWDFQKKQQAKMLRLGYQKVNINLTGKNNETGEIFKTENTWQYFDSLGRYTQRGFKNGGMDTMTFERYFSFGGLFLGEQYFGKEIKENDHARKFVYDSNDSLIEKRWRKTDYLFYKYEYIILNDSSILVKEYKDSLGHGVKYIGSTKVIRSKNAIIILFVKEEKIITEQRFEFNELGNLKYQFKKDINGIIEEFYEYDENGKLISRDTQTQLYNFEIQTTKSVWTYNSNGDLIKWEVFKNEKIMRMLEYQFEGTLLTKQVETEYSPGNELVSALYFKYYSNGLMLSCSKNVDTPTNITYTFIFTYE